MLLELDSDPELESDLESEPASVFISLGAQIRNTCASTDPTTGTDIAFPTPSKILARVIFGGTMDGRMP